jgi:hypothetical protein
VTVWADFEVAMANWVSQQRHFYSLPQDRRELLDELGFVWKGEGLDTHWKQQYAKLVDFKRKNGHCIVPRRRYEQDKSLGLWVSQQRHFGKKNKLLRDRKHLLDKLEFVWNVQEFEWHLQYEKLVALTQYHGHCPVRFMSKDDSSQRSHHKNNTMRQDGKELLNTLEFVCEADPLSDRRSSTTDDVRGLDKALGQWDDTQRNMHAKDVMPKIRWIFLTTSDSFGKSKASKRFGSSNMENWATLNGRMAIVSCLEYTSKTSLWACGLVNSGCCRIRTNCYEIERTSWTSSSSFGMYRNPASIFRMKSWLH